MTRKDFKFLLTACSFMAGAFSRATLDSFLRGEISDKSGGDIAHGLLAITVAIGLVVLALLTFGGDDAD